MIIDQDYVNYPMIEYLSNGRGAILLNRKYKCIKKYPGETEVDDVVTLCGTSNMLFKPMHYWKPSGVDGVGVFYGRSVIENYPEYWTEIKE